MYGPREIDVYRRVGNQYEGFVRVRRSLLRVTAFVLALIAFFALTAGTATAIGIAMFFLAPLLLFLAGVQVAIAFTRPHDSHR